MHVILGCRSIVTRVLAQPHSLEKQPHLLLHSALGALRNRRPTILIIYILALGAIRRRLISERLIPGLVNRAQEAEVRDLEILVRGEGGHLLLTLF